MPVETLSLKAGDALFLKGDKAKNVYIIANGRMAVHDSADGKEGIYDTRERGEILGASSVLTNLPRHMACHAITDTTLIKISSEQVLRDFEQLDPLLRACIETSITFNHRIGHYGTQTVQNVPSPYPTDFDPDLILEKYRFELDLITAIKEQSFTMVYQPIVTLGSGHVVGFEALMRWEHPERGFVPPDVFITVAEQLGMIAPLTDFALAQSCKTLRHLDKVHGKNQRYFASVNISGHDVAREGFSDRLAFILDDHDIAPEQIKLEVTETAIIPNTSAVAENLLAFQNLGCGLSIDDFGTGYSNLAHLKSLPLSALKIDRAFAGDAHKNHVSGCIVSMLVKLGEAMNIDIVAEGVETGDDVKALSDLGCHLAQGYYFHRPAAQKDLFNLIENDKGMEVA